MSTKETKLKMIDAIEDRMKELGKTQNEMADLMQIHPARISNIMHRKVDLFSIGYLMEIGKKAGINFSVEVSK